MSAIFEQGCRQPGSPRAGMQDVECRQVASAEDDAGDRARLQNGQQLRVQIDGRQEARGERVTGLRRCLARWHDDVGTQ
nr:hypothetical protein [Rhodovibrio sodomensis]